MSGKNLPEWKRVRADIYVVLCLLIFGWLATAWVEGRQDATLWDEASYMSYGIHWLAGEKPPASWGPVYALWNAGLATGSDDLGAVQLLNHRLMVVLPAVFFFLCARSWRISRWLAILGALWLWCSGVRVIWPWVAHFNACVFLAGLALAARFARRLSFALCCSVTCLLAAYVRPEYYLAFLISLPVLGWLARSERSTATAGWPVRVLLAPALGVALLFALGSPWHDDAPVSRSFIAFSQHHAVNRFQADGGSNPWVNHEEYTRAAFGPVHGVWAALRANPGEFFWHVRRNLLHWPSAQFRLLLPAWLAAIPGPAARVSHLILCFALGLAVLTGGRWLSRFGRWRRLLESERMRRLLAVFLVVLAVVLPSILLVFPRDHYLILPGLLGLLGALCLLDMWLPALKPRTGTLLTLVLPCFMVLNGEMWITSTAPPPAQLNLQTLRALRQIAPQASLPVLDGDGGYALLLRPPFECVQIEDKQPGETLGAFIRHRNIRCIVMTYGLTEKLRRSGDPDYARWKTNPARAGFRVVPITETGRELWFVEPAPGD